MGKYDHIDFKPPKSVSDAAKRGLELRKNNKGRGGLSSGQAKKEGVGSGVQRATNLKNRDTMSPATVKRMKAFFDRHESSKKTDKGKKQSEDKGYIAWMLWGGDPGRSWANKVVKQMEAADKKSKKKKANLFAEQLGLPTVLAESEGDYMAHQNMCAIHMKAEDLKQALSQAGELEDWIEDKISGLADDIAELHDYFTHGHGKEQDAKDKAPWKEKREPEGKLTDSQKQKAKARAKRNNRPYPNQVDNMWAAQQ